MGSKQSFQDFFIRCALSLLEMNSTSRSYLKHTGNARSTQHWGAFALQLLQWKNNKY